MSCDSYVWHGEIYTESGVYTFNTTNQFGCDSTATLNLVINNSSFLLRMLRHVIVMIGTVLLILRVVFILSTPLTILVVIQQLL